MNKNILIRADSSLTIGTGHIMRDLVLAEQFTDANIIFATQDLPGNTNQPLGVATYTIETQLPNDLKDLLPSSEEIREVLGE
jgi:spore coat polysaccharide biosynthesis predicted glycosyltransferase SpsG